MSPYLVLKRVGYGIFSRIEELMIMEGIYTASQNPFSDGPKVDIHGSSVYHKAHVNENIRYH
jgi:hypothetical protein